MSSTSAIRRLMAGVTPISVVLRVRRSPEHPTPVEVRVVTPDGLKVGRLEWRRPPADGENDDVQQKYQDNVGPVDTLALAVAALGGHVASDIMVLESIACEELSDELAALGAALAEAAIAAAQSEDAIERVSPEFIADVSESGRVRT